jgi:hypothetical protein
VSAITAAIVLGTMAVVFHILNYMPLGADKAEMRIWLAAKLDEFLRYSADIPGPKNRKRHTTLAQGLIATAVFALGALGYQLLESHPCIAWLMWTVAFLFGTYSFWEITPIYRWCRIAVLLVMASVFVYFGHQSIYSRTELNFFFVNPGVFVVQGNGEWLLLVTGENTRKSLFNVEMVLEDVVTARAIPGEPDLAKREGMIRGGTIIKTYPEIGPTFLGDRVLWRPIDVNDQEYSVQARYRIGERAFLSIEEIRIVNVGTRFISAAQMTVVPIWQFSVAVKNQSGEILMHCVDPGFPHDARWIAGPACFPGAKYGPLPRPLCTRCFGRGFEFYP